MKKITVSVHLLVKILAAKAWSMDGEIVDLPLMYILSHIINQLMLNQPEQTACICSTNNSANFLIQNCMVMGQVQTSQSLPFLLRFSHFSWINTPWIIVCLQLIYSVLKKLILTFFWSVFWLLLGRNGVSEVLYRTELGFACPTCTAKPIYWHGGVLKESTAFICNAIILK